MTYDSDQMASRRKVALIDRWPSFFTWLSETYGFCIDNVVPGKPQHCPVHGGDSGEAFKFFEDFMLTGGGICNSSCIKMSTGDKMVAGWVEQLKKLNNPQFNKIVSDLAPPNDSGDVIAGLLIDAFLAEQGIEIPPPKVGSQVTRWIKAIDTRVALRYLNSRGLAFTAKNLPQSIRGTKRYWAHPELQNAEGLLALVYGENDRPVTHQVILTNSFGEKLGTRPEDKKYLDILAENSGKKPSVKKLAFLDKQEDLTFRYVPLGNLKSEVLLLGEGVETVLAGRLVFEDMEGFEPMARAMVGSPYQNQRIPAHIKKVIALVDNDHTIEQAEEQLSSLAAQYSDKEFWMAVPEKWSVESLSDSEKKGKVAEKGKDWLDTYVRYGVKKASEVWKAGLKQVRPGVIVAGSLHNGVEPNKRFQKGGFSTESLDIPVPISDHRFFRNLNGFLKRNPLGWYSTDGGSIRKLVDSHIADLDEETMLSDMASHLQFVNDVAPSRNSKPKEVSFPESRIRRWLKTPSFRAQAKGLLPRLETVQRSFLVFRDQSEWQFVGQNGYFRDKACYIEAHPVHAKALSRAESWMSQCEVNPELTLVDVALIKPELARHLRSTRISMDPATLIRVTTVLMIEEIFKHQFRRGEEHAEFLEAIFSGLLMKDAPLAPDFANDFFSSFGSRDSDFERKEALLGIVYLAVLGWLKYSDTSVVLSSDEAVNGMLGWCNITGTKSKHLSEAPVSKFRKTVV
jgi:hypothetical protein